MAVHPPQAPDLPPWPQRLRADPAFAVTAVVDPDPRTRAAVGDSDPTAAVFGGVDELSPCLVDLAVVAVPNHLHCAVACALLYRGIPVFLEKPVCLTSVEAEQLSVAEQAGGGVLLAGSAARYRADVQALHGLAGPLGRIRHADIAWVRARGVPGGGGWFTQVAAGHWQAGCATTNPEAALPALLADPGNRGRAIDDTARTIAAIERIYASAGVDRRPHPVGQDRGPHTPTPVAAGR